MTDIVLSPVENNDDFDHEIRIGDSGASCHYFNNDEGLYNCKNIHFRENNGWERHCTEKWWKTHRHAQECEVCAWALDQFVQNWKSLEKSMWYWKW
jgi:hypothetical protein